MPRIGCGKGHASLPLAVVLWYFAAGSGFGAVRRGASRRPSRRRRRRRRRRPRPRPRHHRHRCHRRCRPFSRCQGSGNELAQELKGQHHNS